MPFGFLKRRKDDARRHGSGAGGDAGVRPPGLHAGSLRGVPFTALTEDWRLRGRMDITGRLSDALNKREAIAITDVSWGATGRRRRWTRRRASRAWTRTT